MAAEPEQPPLPPEGPEEEEGRLSGERIPPVDAGALSDLASGASAVAASVEELLEGLRGALECRSALALSCVRSYRSGAEALGESVGAALRSLYTLLARCEELEREMRALPALARSLREMEGALDRLEGLCK